MNRQGDAEIKRTLDRLRVLANDPKELLGIIDGVEALLLAKGDDYSGKEDAFANFMFISTASMLPVYRVFMMLVAVKIGRLRNLFQTHATYPKFESSWDTVRDLLGYLVLWLAFTLTQEGESDAVHSDPSS